MKFLDRILKKRLVGLDIGLSGIKAVELQGGKRPRLMAYNRVPLPWETILPDGEIRDRQAVVKALKTLFDRTKFSSRKVAVGASGNAVITKKITVPRMNKDELNHQLYWEAEQFIPFNLNDVNLDYAILGNTAVTVAAEPQMDVLLVAAKKEYIENISSILEEAELIPEVIDIQAFALGNVYEFNYGHVVDSSPGVLSIIVDFGAGSTKVSAVEGDKTIFTRDLRQCGSGCTLSISDVLNVDIGEAENLKITQANNPTVAQVLNAYNDNLVTEVSRTIDFCVSQGADRNVQGIYVCGGASKTQGLFQQLEQKLPAPVHVLNPIQNISGSGKKMNANAVREICYLGSVAIGLGLRTVGDLE